MNSDVSQAPQSLTAQNSTKFRVARKPLKSGSANENRSQNGERTIDDQLGQLDLGAATSRPNLIIETDLPPRVTNSQLFASPGRADTGFNTASTCIDSSSASIETSFSLSSVSSTSPAQSSRSSKSEYLQNAYQEARHFAGGLITHPYESTKHYTILRHSHGLVFYQGTSTTLAISIFASAPLPPERTLWLQCKGWSGKRGMRAKAFVGANGNWLNVTPSMGVSVEQLKPTDERAWQRDIAHFQKKTKAHNQKSHILRETAIVRIPADAGDRYFQLVLCLGEKKKVLCPSPVFRILSTSSSPSSLRGASLRTLPLELGAKALTMYTRNTVGTVIAPVTSVLQSRVQQYMPSWWIQEAATATYDTTGAAEKVNAAIENANGRYDQVRDDSFMMVGQVEAPVDNGPQSPFPIHLCARCENDTEVLEQFRMPAIQLGASTFDVSKLMGYYFGWARLMQKIKTRIVPSEDENLWYQAVLSALPIDASQLSRATIGDASKKVVKIRLAEQYGDSPPDYSHVEVYIMGFIRPDEPAQRALLLKGLREGDEAAIEAAELAEINDITMAQSILSQPLWSVEGATAALQRDDVPKGLEKVMSGYANTRMAAQTKMDRIPLQKMGIHMPFDPLKEKMMVANGFYVQR